MQQSKVMTEFCRDYINWINNGTPSHEIFNIRSGLCRSWMLYILNNDDVSGREITNVYSELKKLFKEENLDPVFPFNTSRSDYMDEMISQKSHLNEQRIKWVMEHSQLLEIQNG